MDTLLAASVVWIIAFAFYRVMQDRDHKRDENRDAPSTYELMVDASKRAHLPLAVRQRRVRLDGLAVRAAIGVMLASALTVLFSVVWWLFD